MVSLNDYGVEKQTSKLSNGVRVIHFKKEHSPLEIRLSSCGGGRLDPKGKAGLAHLTEHLVFEGTKRFPSKRDLAFFIEDAGAAFVGSTSRETINFSFVVAGEEELRQIQPAIEDILNFPTFKESKIESEKCVVLNEALRREDSLSGALRKALIKMMFGEENPILRDVTGDAESLKNIQREDVLDYFFNILPLNMTVVSCGGINVSGLVGALDGIVPFKSFKRKVTPVDISGIIGKKHVIKRKTRACRVVMAFPTCPMDQLDDLMSLSCLSSVIGRGRASVLLDKLRYQDSLLYSISTRSSSTVDLGYFQISFVAEKEKLKNVLKRVEETLGEVRAGKLESGMLEFAKRKRVNLSKISHQTSGSWVNFHAAHEVLGFFDYDFAEYLNKLSSVTMEDVTRVANKYLVKERMFVCAVGDLELEDIS